MLNQVMIQKIYCYGPLIGQTYVCTITCPFTANSSCLPCVGSADFVQEPEIYYSTLNQGNFKVIRQGAKKKPVVAEVNVISLKLREVLIHVKVTKTRESNIKETGATKCEREMADTYVCISCELLCVLFLVFCSRNFNKHKEEKN